MSTNQSVTTSTSNQAGQTNLAHGQRQQSLGKKQQGFVVFLGPIWLALTAVAGITTAVVHETNYTNSASATSATVAQTEAPMANPTSGEARHDASN